MGCKAPTPVPKNAVKPPPPPSPPPKRVICEDDAITMWIVNKLFKRV